LNVNKFSQTPSVLKCHNSRYFGKQRIVAAYPHVMSGFKLGTPLPDDDGTPADELSGKTLHAKPLGLAVSSIPGASHSLFVCHTNLLTCNVDLIDDDL
jgi:hypothetical protein